MIKKTSLRSKTKIFLVLLFLVVGAFGAFFLKTIMLSSLNEIERIHVKEHVGRVEKAIQENLNQLQQTSQDYGAWDDSYEYVVDHNEDYELSNLNETTLTNLHLDMMVYVDEGGQYVFAKAMDSSTEKLIPIYESMRENLKKSGVLTNVDPNMKVKGIIQLAEGPMLIASFPILQSDYSGPVRGNLIFGRLLNQETIDKIGENLDLQLRLERIDKSHNPTFDKLTVEAPILLDSSDANTILSYSILSDLFKKPAVGLIVSMNRDVSSVGRTALNSLAISLAVIALASILLIDLFFDKQVLVRLKKLSENVRNIGNDDLNAYSYPDDHKNDEISAVSNAINIRTKQMVETKDALAKETELRKLALDKIEHLAYYDSLTGLPNRVLLVNRIQQAINLAKRIEKPIGILFLDLDGFKAVNDTLGHLQGDELLKAVAGRLTALVRESDTVARIGGDEFIIMTQNLEMAKHIHTVADKVIEAFKEPFELNHHEVYVTVSVGMSIYPIDGDTYEVLIKNADLAMYKAKSLGKNQCVLCTASLK